MLLDYHIHSFLSDGVKNPKEYLGAAIQKKINEIGFSEHLNFKDFDWVMKFSDLPLYVKIVDDLRKTSEIPIKLGVEIDFIPGFEEKIEKIINEWPFDYVLGSVHLINGFQFDNLKKEIIAEYGKFDIDELYEKYFGLVQKAAKSKLFDVMAHPDLIKKMGFKPKNDITNLLEETADCFARTGVCIEVNTSGLDKPCEEIYPSEKFLKMCYDRKIPITFGSDAHKPDDIGKYFDRALDSVKKVGYKEIVQFDRRKKIFLEI